MMLSVTSYILGLGMLNLAQRYMTLAPTCAFLLLFSFEWRVFLYDFSILFAYTDQLAGHMAVFTSKSPCSMYKLGLAASFQLSLELLHSTNLTPDFRNRFDPLGPDPASWSTRLYCCACALSQWCQWGTDGSHSSSRAFKKEPRGN